jgi:hypothetical protein
VWSPKNQNRSSKTLRIPRKCRKRHPLRSLGALCRSAVKWGLLYSAATASLLVAPAIAQNRGQADIALQGYYLGGSSQPLISTTGVAARFQDFMPGLGFLSGSVEAYGAENRFQTGENFLQLRGFPWMGQHWTVTGGDFSMPGTLVEFPFNNIFNPEINARGIKVQATHDSTEYTFFAGEETLFAGPRVPYRILAPQTVAGFSVVRRLARTFTIGARVMQFSSSQQSIADNPNLFPVGRELGLIRNASVQALYAPAKKLKFYAEASRPLEQMTGALTSAFGGVSYVTTNVTLRANYTSQGVNYFPLAGYFAGDRRGPFAEARFRLLKRLEFFGSASQYRNNLENNPAVASLTSNSTTAGVTATLPGQVAASGQVSTVGFTSSGAGEDPSTSYNRQISATLSRAIRRHSVRVTWRDINLDMAPSSQRQGSTEVEDIFQVKRLFLGGAVRLQQTSGTEQRNTMYYRGSAQGNLGPVSLYANVEIGNDLANRTIFSTSAYSTTVAGVGVHLSRNWNLQAEAFRNKLNMDLNPESIFVLQGGGMPIGENLAALMQWSMYIKITRQFRWNGGMPSEAVDTLAATAVPLMGAVEGIVRLKRLSGESVVSGIPVTLDGSRCATTGSDGHYRFESVPEGRHELALAADQLPAEYDPGPVNNATLLVQSRKTARTDFNVLPLATLDGQVTGSPGAALDGIVIRIVPGSRYTMTDTDGRFVFYNVREGDFELVLDPVTLPENAVLGSPASVPLVVRVGASIPEPRFSFTVSSQEKTIRKVLDKK